MTGLLLRAIFVTVFAIISVNCFAIHSQRNVKIIGGSEAEPGQFAHQVSLTNKGSIRLNITINAHTCSGSILSDRWIITAGRCMASTIPEEYIIVVGPNRTLAHNNTYDIGLVVTHPEYNSDRWLANDVALIKTKTPIVLNDWVQPIELSSTVLDENVECQVCGFGFNQYPTVSIGINSPL